MTNGFGARCPVCDSNEVSRCIQIADVPVYCNVLLSSREQAINTARGDIELTYCKSCGHVFNSAFDVQKINYTQEYENSLHFSPRFQEYASSLAEQLVDRYQLYRKTIIEIACGKGEFLASICALGNNKGIGFDPSYVPGHVNDDTLENVEFIQDYYSEKYSAYQANLICCRQALEHIETPIKFLNTVRRAIGNQKDCAVFFEVPNVMFTLKDMGIWDLIYEHCSYFCADSLKKAFQISGYEVSNVQTTFGHQFLCADAFPNDINELNIDSSNGVEGVEEYAEKFEQSYKEKTEIWKSRLEDFKRRGLKVVVWGAGSKGVTFLNALNIREEVEYIVDLNPHKHGKFVPGTGHEVVAPNYLKTCRPEAIIVMNPLYTEEIGRIVGEMDIKAAIISE